MSADYNKLNQAIERVERIFVERHPNVPGAGAFVQLRARVPVEAAPAEYELHFARQKQIFGLYVRRLYDNGFQPLISAPYTVKRAALDALHELDQACWHAAQNRAAEVMELAKLYQEWSPR